MSLREASVTDEKIAIDFVAGAHGRRMYEGYRDVRGSRSLVKSYRVSGPIEGGVCERSADVRKLRTGGKSE